MKFEFKGARPILAPCAQGCAEFEVPALEGLMGWLITKRHAEKGSEPVHDPRERLPRQLAPREW